MVDVKDLIRKKAVAAGIDPTTALAFAQIESGLDPSAGKGTKNPHGGLFQFSPALWEKYGGGKDIYDPEANTDAFTAYYNNDLSPGMRSKLGRPATPAELYIGHQQGVSGGSTLLNGGDQNVVDALTPAYGNADQAKAAISANGGDPTKTAGDFTEQWGDNFNTAAKAFDPNYDGGSIAVSTPAEPAMAQGTPGSLGGLLASALPGAAAASPATGLLAKKADPYKDLMSQGMGLLASASPPAQQMQMPVAQAQAYRPQATALPSFVNPDLQKKLLGLLGEAA